MEDYDELPFGTAKTCRRACFSNESVMKSREYGPDVLCCNICAKPLIIEGQKYQHCGSHDRDICEKCSAPWDSPLQDETINHKGISSAESIIISCGPGCSPVKMNIQDEGIKYDVRILMYNERNKLFSLTSMASCVIEIRSEKKLGMVSVEIPHCAAIDCGSQLMLVQQHRMDEDMIDVKLSNVVAEPEFATVKVEVGTWTRLQLYFPVVFDS